MYTFSPLPTLEATRVPKFVPAFEGYTFGVVLWEGRKGLEERTKKEDKNTVNTKCVCQPPTALGRVKRYLVRLSVSDVRAVPQTCPRLRQEKGRRKVEKEKRKKGKGKRGSSTQRE